MVISTCTRFIKSPTLKALVMSVGMAATQMAFAQSAGFSGQQIQGLCVIPQMIKVIAGVIALVACLLWAISHMNSKSEISDIAMKVAIPCAIASIVGYLVQQFGLSNSCGLT